MNDSGATSSVEAFFETKTYTAHKSRYGHNHTITRPADHKVILIVSQEYARIFKKLGRKFAAEVVCETINVAGFFQTAQQIVHKGQVIPVAVG